jgi:hypothetical protein
MDWRQNPKKLSAIVLVFVALGATFGERTIRPIYDYILYDIFDLERPLWKKE